MENFCVKRAKFCGGVYTRLHMDNDRIRVDEDEDENEVELNVSNSFHAAQDDEGDEMLLFAGTGQNRIE